VVGRLAAERQNTGTRKRLEASNQFERRQPLTKNSCEVASPAGDHPATYVLKRRLWPKRAILHHRGGDNMSCTKCVLGVFVFVGSLIAADPAIGTWKLNPAKSKFSPGPPPQSATVTYEASGEGVRRTGEAANADGTKNSFEYTAQ
jgi:hypothetical protein